MNQEHPSSSRPELDDSSEAKKTQENQPQKSQSQEKQDSAETTETSPTSQDGTGLLSTLQTILGAMFGVQSEKQRQKDFEKGNPVHFIIGGIIFVVVFILTILYFVDTALENAGVG
ncbi:DUF2970 domain-containing protein [Kangiella spongicola]|uniref:DUF2970 domain-containing protein n=1 Tax=Kangiella spongicola TaxID=796379 RepID=A0A318D3Q9_9GAMM|nr:DUF2970 domain-containing protein [Kangiella spongicola]PXF63860.1 hypothetical protein DL796_01575 [Kangiella spongicola]